MKKFLLTAAAVFVMTGCSITSNNSGNVSNLDDVDFSKEFKTGEACETTVLIFGPFGDSSVVEAAKSANIKKVELVEYKRNGYVLFSERCAIVHGV